MNPPTESTGYGTMIVTLTMNPALDVTTSADRVGPTNKIRCSSARYDAGGGINVARIAQVLGGSVSAVFPAGGYTGDTIANLVHVAGVSYRRVDITESTRESVTIDERKCRRIVTSPTARTATDASVRRLTAAACAVITGAAPQAPAARSETASSNSTSLSELRRASP